MESWYVTQGCVNPESLQPVWFIVMCNLLQFIWTMLTFVPSKTTDGYWKTAPKALYAIWAVYKILYNAAFDFSKIASIESTDWISCSGAIIFTSSNYKSTIINIYVPLCRYAIFEDKMGNIKWYQIVTLIATIIYCLVQGMWVTMLIAPAWFVVLWPLWVIVILAFILLCTCGKNGEWFGICFLLVVCIVIIFYALTSSLSGLVMINILGGMEYWESYELVLSERHLKTWWNYQLENPSQFITFITWLF
eukprot:372726_1